MFLFIFGPLFSIALNAQLCAVNPADTHSVIEAMKPGACKGRQEVYVFNK